MDYSCICNVCLIRSWSMLFLSIVGVDYWKIICLAIGVLTFFSAKKLSNNTLFYYLCGISFGICTSFLILIYFISKLFPKVSIFTPIYFSHDFSILLETDDVWCCNLRLDSWGVHFTNALGEYKNDFAQLPNIRCMVCNFHRSY